jgi:hypothetical protein
LLLAPAVKTDAKSLDQIKLQMPGDIIPGNNRCGGVYSLLNRLTMEVFVYTFDTKKAHSGCILGNCSKEAAVTDGFHCRPVAVYTHNYRSLALLGQCAVGAFGLIVIGGEYAINIASLQNVLDDAERPFPIRVGRLAAFYYNAVFPEYSFGSVGPFGHGHVSGGAFKDSNPSAWGKNLKHFPCAQNADFKIVAADVG